MSVFVAVRSRPLTAADTEKTLCVSMEDNTVSLTSPSLDSVMSFTYDACFWSTNQPNLSGKSPYASQEDVFKVIGQSSLDYLLEGYNGCIFAYGQTGSGKTYSMFGTSEDQGLFPRISASLFKMINTMTSPAVQFSVEATFYEVYNEKIRCLLTPADERQEVDYLRVREHPTLGVFIEGLKHETINSSEMLMEVLHRGMDIRTVGATSMNISSSRSHSIFCITVIRTSHQGGVSIEVKSSLNLVDLAGSERQSKTGAEGVRFFESTNINRSLTTLGMVIHKLAKLSSMDANTSAIALSGTNSDGSRTNRFIPFRDSVLTRILKDHLSGKSKVIMLGTVSPSVAQYGETLSTLRFADQVKNVAIKAVIQRPSGSFEASSLKQRIKVLEKQLEEYLSSTHSSISPIPSSNARNGEWLNPVYSFRLIDDLSLFSGKKKEGFLQSSAVICLQPILDLFHELSKTHTDGAPLLFENERQKVIYAMLIYYLAYSTLPSAFFSSISLVEEMKSSSAIESKLSEMFGTVLHQMLRERFLSVSSSPSLEGTPVRIGKEIHEKHPTADNSSSSFDKSSFAYDAQSRYPDTFISPSMPYYYWQRAIPKARAFIEGKELHSISRPIDDSFIPNTQSFIAWEPQLISPLVESSANHYQHLLSHQSGSNETISVSPGEIQRPSRMGVSEIEMLWEEREAALTELFRREEREIEKLWRYVNESWHMWDFLSPWISYREQNCSKQEREFIGSFRTTSSLSCDNILPVRYLWLGKTPHTFRTMGRENCSLSFPKEWLFAVKEYQYGVSHQALWGIHLTSGYLLRLFLTPRSEIDRSIWWIPQDIQEILAYENQSNILWIRMSGTAKPQKEWVIQFTHSWSRRGFLELFHLAKDIEIRPVFKQSLPHPLRWLAIGEFMTVSPSSLTSSFHQVFSSPVSSPSLELSLEKAKKVQPSRKSYHVLDELSPIEVILPHILLPHNDDHEISLSHLENNLSSPIDLSTPVGYLSKSIGLPVTVWCGIIQRQSCETSCSYDWEFASKHWGMAVPLEFYDMYIFVVLPPCGESSVQTSSSHSKLSVTLQSSENIGWEENGQSNATGATSDDTAQGKLNDMSNSTNEREIRFLKQFLGNYLGVSNYICVWSSHFTASSMDLASPIVLIYAKNAVVPSIHGIEVCSLLLSSSLPTTTSQVEVSPGVSPSNPKSPSLLYKESIQDGIQGRYYGGISWAIESTRVAFLWGEVQITPLCSHPASLLLYELFPFHTLPLGDPLCDFTQRFNVLWMAVALNTFDLSFYAPLLPAVSYSNENSYEGKQKGKLSMSTVLLNSIPTNSATPPRNFLCVANDNMSHIHLLSSSVPISILREEQCLGKGVMESNEGYKLFSLRRGWNLLSYSHLNKMDPCDGISNHRLDDDLGHSSFSYFPPPSCGNDCYQEIMICLWWIWKSPQIYANNKTPFVENSIFSDSNLVFVPFHSINSNYPALDLLSPICQSPMVVKWGNTMCTRSPYTFPSSQLTRLVISMPVLRRPCSQLWRVLLAPHPVTFSKSFIPSLFHSPWETSLPHGLIQFPHHQLVWFSSLPDCPFFECDTSSLPSLRIRLISDMLIDSFQSPITHQQLLSSFFPSLSCDGEDFMSELLHQTENITDPQRLEGSVWIWEPFFWTSGENRSDHPELGEKMVCIYPNFTWWDYQGTIRILIEMNSTNSSADSNNPAIIVASGKWAISNKWQPQCLAFPPISRQEESEEIQRKKLSMSYHDILIPLYVNMKEVGALRLVLRCLTFS